MAQMVFRRHEIKYLLSDEQRARLELAMAIHMVPDEYGPSTVRNIYYDTPSFILARRSAEHPRYKEKLRLRSYTPVGEQGRVFLELKKKFKGIVYKRRCTLAYASARALLAGQRDPQTQIEREIAFSASRFEGLAPAMYVAYDREAFYAADDRDFRMTFDRAVRCRWDNISLAGPTDGQLLTPAGQNLLEVKCAQGMPLWLVDFFSEEQLYKGSFSKYGAAVSRRLGTAAPRPALVHQPAPARPAPAEASARPALRVAATAAPSLA